MEDFELVGRDQRLVSNEVANDDRPLHLQAARLLLHNVQVIVNRLDIPVYQQLPVAAKEALGEYADVASEICPLSEEARESTPAEEGFNHLFRIGIRQPINNFTTSISRLDYDPEQENTTPAIRTALVRGGIAFSAIWEASEQNLTIRDHQWSFREKIDQAAGLIGYGS